MHEHQRKQRRETIKRWKRQWPRASAALLIEGNQKPNARVNRRLPAKLVDVLLNEQLGRGAEARFWVCAFELMMAKNT